MRSLTVTEAAFTSSFLHIPEAARVLHESTAGPSYGTGRASGR